ncbi:MAG: hypothetical protein ABIH83_00750 [Candidatus Micrarchaeota archaeon]
MAFVREIIFSAIIGVLLISTGCVQENTTPQSFDGLTIPTKQPSFVQPTGVSFSPEEECVNACHAAFGEGQDLSAGPCLLNPMEQNKDWVCDVAHSPREDVDNMQENQCDAFRKGIAHHFIEVDEGCEVIKVY